MPRCRDAAMRMFCLLFACIPVAVKAQNFIIGGSPISISQAPWIVSVEEPDAQGVFGHVGGGSIINSEWVLTAAHVVITHLATDPTDLRVHAGSTDQTNNNIGQRVGVDLIIFHPEWESITGENDMALLHLSTPLCFNENVQPVLYATPQNTPPSIIAPGTMTFMCGWGIQSTSNQNNPPPSAILMGASLPIISNSQAQSLLNTSTCGVRQVKPSMLSVFTPGISASPYDSGGPVTATLNGTTFLIGVINWTGCPYGQLPTVNSNVRASSDFITNNITNAPVPCSCPDFDTHIQVNTVYNNSMDMPGNIIIHTGAQLLVEAKIGMRQHKNIIVERGARLIVDNGGVLSRGCNAPDWGGVVVMGNPNIEQPQYNGSLSNPDQAGIVWLDNATIEWARRGITTGQGTNSRGGLIWTNNATFQNNRKAVEIMRYRYSDVCTNQSRFFNTTFKEGNMFSAFPNTEGVTIWDTDDIEFHNCTFQDFDFEGIRAYDAAVRVVNACDFRRNEIGISAYASYPMSRYLKIGDTEYGGNFFEDNLYDVEASPGPGFTGNYGSGRYQLSILDNYFQNADNGVFIDGPSNFLVGGNTFSNTKVSIETVNTSFNTFFNQTLAACNEMLLGNLFGILALGDNRTFQFLGNTFDMVSPGADFILSNTSTPSTVGEIDLNQGNSDIPAGNCFTGGGRTDIGTTGPTKRFSYWYDNAGDMLDCIVEPVTAGNYDRDKSQQNWDPNVCAAYESGPQTATAPATLEVLEASRANLEILAAAMATNPAMAAQYQQALRQKDALLVDLVATAITASQYEVAEQLLLAENTKTANWAIFGLRMNRGDYVGALAWLNSLPIEDETDEAFKAVQTINLQRFQAGGFINLTSEQEATLNTVAESGSPVRGFARAILGILKDRRFYPDNVELLEERSNKQTQSEATVGFTLSPVPAAQEVTITWPLFEADAAPRLLICDLLGKTLLSIPLAQRQTQKTVDVAQWPSGLYFATVSNKGKVVHEAKFSVQH